MRPVVLDFDRSVGALPNELRIDLCVMESSVRLFCRRDALQAVRRRIDAEVVPDPAVLFLGSGDFHHVALASIQRLSRRPGIDVVVFDNHPDNMRHVPGVHCGSWVGHVARLPFVRTVDVLGITSADACGAHLCLNDLAPLWRGKLRYWCIGLDTRWARGLGLRDAVLSFDAPEAMLDRFFEGRTDRDIPVYLSIDKDVLRRDVIATNWDQGILTEAELLAAIASLGRRTIGADVTGEISPIRYPVGWKRLLSALDGQAPVDMGSLPAAQASHRALNERLLRTLSSVGPL